MCIGCYEEAGCPKIINDKVLKSVEAIKELYATDDGGVGGYGHIVFDDWNVYTDNILWCIEEAEKGNYEDTSEETRQASLIALNYFVNMSEDERYSALALVDGFISLKQ